MKRLGIDVEKIKAIFISPEHSDLTRGVATASKKWGLPVYITTTTLQFSGLWLEKEHITEVPLPKDITIGDLTINAFPKRTMQQTQNMPAGRPFRSFFI